jgi:hypothetical protein
MADQIKELSNGTYFIGALTNGVSIAGTDATTRNVVKDIYVQNNQLTAVGATLDFVVNGVNVAGIDSSVTGSEIIDVSSTAVAQATASFQDDIFQILMPSTSVGAKINTFSTKRVGGVLSYVAPVTQSAAITAAFTNGTNIRGYATIGSNFYYWTNDGATAHNLYRRAGGINGTQTTVPDIAANMPVIFDGVDKFYWLAASSIFTHNATTNTNTSVTLLNAGTDWTTALTNNPRISYANGLVFWTSTTNGGTAAKNGVFAINPTTGGMLDIGLAVGNLGSIIGVQTQLEVFYSNSVYYIVSTQNAVGPTDLFVRTIADVGPLTTSGGQRNATTFYSVIDTYTPENAIGINWPTADSTRNKLYFMSDATNPAAYSYVIKVFDPITGTFDTSLTIDLTSVSPNTTTASEVKLSNFALVDNSANKTNTTFYPQSVTLRVTGVQTTP